MTNKPLWQRQKLRQKALHEPAICPDDKLLNQRQPRSVAVGSISFQGSQELPPSTRSLAATIYICTANLQRLQTRNSSLSTAPEPTHSLYHLLPAKLQEPFPLPAVAGGPCRRAGPRAGSWASNFRAKARVFAGQGTRTHTKPAAWCTAQEGNQEPDSLARGATVFIMAHSGFKILMLMKSLPERTPGINCHLIIATRWQGKRKADMHRMF